jgi:hypothetical protein
LQLVKVKNSVQQIEFDVESTSDKVSLMLGSDEVGSITYEQVYPGLIAQDYIVVDEKYKKLGLSYVLINLCASVNSNATIVYLKGGSLSPSGAGLASALGFKKYEPNPSQQSDNILLDKAYKRQREDAGLTESDTETIPPIRWISRSELESTVNEKIVAGGWQIVE